MVLSDQERMSNALHHNWPFSVEDKRNLVLRGLLEDAIDKHVKVEAI